MTKHARYTLGLIVLFLSISTSCMAGDSDHHSAQISVTTDTSTTTKPPAVIVRTLPSTDSAYESLLKPPASNKLRSGFVCLKPGKSGEEHSTEGYEEMILILSGSGELQFADQHLPLGAGQFAYVPPHTTHFVKNAGSDPLRYIYIVTKVEP